MRLKKLRVDELDHANIREFSFNVMRFKKKKQNGVNERVTIYLS